MTLYEILDLINESTVVEVFDSATYERYATYEGKENIPDWLLDCDITDIFTGMSDKTPTLCIELALEATEHECYEGKRTPCDYPDEDGHFHCPYDADGSDDCRRYCGLGVDE